MRPGGRGGLLRSQMVVVPRFVVGIDSGIRKSVRVFILLRVRHNHAARKMLAHGLHLLLGDAEDAQDSLERCT